MQNQRHKRDAGNGNVDRKNESHRLLQIVENAPAGANGRNNGRKMII
jgi:hypothetical protein